MRPSTYSPLKGGKLCFKQRVSSVYPPVPLWLILYPLTPLGQRGPVCRRKHSTGHHTDTQTRGCSRTAGEEELGRKWREPPPGGHILSLGKTGLFVRRSELFVCMCAQKHSCQWAKNCANLSREGHPQRAYPSALVACAIDQDGTATCGILQQNLLPADLINSLQTERLIPQQTPTYPFLPPSSSHSIQSPSPSPWLPYPSATICYQFSSS